MPPTASSTSKVDGARVCPPPAPSGPVQTTGALRSSPARKRPKFAPLRRTTSTQTDPPPSPPPPLTPRDPPAPPLGPPHTRPDAGRAPPSICEGAVSSVTTGGDCGHSSAAAVSDDAFGLCLADLELRVWLLS